jgi:NagD protein
MEKLAKAHSCIEAGARLLATNPDNWCPVSAHDTRPGAGATAAFLEASTGRRAYYLGKPNGYMFQRARRKLGEMAAGMPDQIVVIGDTMETDIRGAIEAGLQAYLVLSGSTTVEQVADYVYQPTRVLSSVADLIEEIQSGKPSNRLDSPVYTQAFSRNHRPGRRHQTDAEHVSTPRPRAPMTR